MLVLSVQRRRDIKKIYQGLYQPTLWMSRFAYATGSSVKGYKTMLKLLSKKTGRPIGDLQSCYWGWVVNPFLDFYKVQYAESIDKNLDDRYYAVFVDVPRDEALLSNYDLWDDYISGKTGSLAESFRRISSEDCVQASFLEIDPRNIRCICDIKWLPEEPCRSVSEILQQCSRYDEKYKLEVLLPGDSQEFKFPCKVS